MTDHRSPASRSLPRPQGWPQGWGRPLLAGTVALLAASPAWAYVGPGAGLSLLGALWGVVAAIVLALAFVVIWPVRRLIKRRAGPTGTPAVTPSAVTSSTGDRTTTP